MENTALQSLQILYTFVLRAQIRNQFGYQFLRMCVQNWPKLAKIIFSVFYKFSQGNFAVLLILKYSF